MAASEYSDSGGDTHYVCACDETKRLGVHRDHLADVLAQRDRRVAAEALREAAEEAVGMGQGQTRHWLRERADRIEAGHE